jgi:hypothetical protein
LVNVKEQKYIERILNGSDALRHICVKLISTCKISKSNTTKSLEHNKITVSRLKIFDSVTYVYMSNQRRTKLDDKSKKYTFIGYDERTKAFKLFDLIERKVIVSRDVHVNEESAWNWNNQNKVTHEEGEPSTSTSIITPTSHLTYDDEDEPK